MKKSGVEVCLNSVVCRASYENLYSDIPKEREEEGMEEKNKVTISFKKIKLFYIYFYYYFFFLIKLSFWGKSFSSLPWLFSTVAQTITILGPS